MTQQLTRPNRQSSQIVRKRFFNGRSREVVLYASISKRFGPILYLSASYTWSQVIIFPSLLLFRSVSVSFPRKLHVLNLLILLSWVLLTPLTSLYECWCPDNYKTVVDCKIWRCFSWEKYWNVYCGEAYNIQLFYINPDNSLLCGIMVLTSLSLSIDLRSVLRIFRSRGDIIIAGERQEILGLRLAPSAKHGRIYLWNGTSTFAVSSL